MSEMNEKSRFNEIECYQALARVIDPELGIDIVELGLVYTLEIQDSTVSVEMTMTSPGCPLAEEILFEANNELLKISGVEKADIHLVWSPPWGPEKMTEDAQIALGLA